MCSRVRVGAVSGSLNVILSGNILCSFCRVCVVVFCVQRIFPRISSVRSLVLSTLSVLCLVLLASCIVQNLDASRSKNEHPNFRA